MLQWACLARGPVVGVVRSLALEQQMSVLPFALGMSGVWQQHRMRAFEAW